MKHTFIKNLNISHREGVVLDTLLSSNTHLTVSEVGVKLSLPRQTALSVLKRLSGLGLIVQTSHNGKLAYKSSVNNILGYIEIEKSRLNEIKSNLEKKKSGVFSKSDIQGSNPSVEFYTGTYALKRMLENILKTYREGKSKLFKGYGINFFSDAPGLEEYLDYFIKKRDGYGVKTNLIVAKGPDGFNIEPGKEFGRSIKKIYIDPQYAALYLVANKIYLFSFKDNVGIMISNKAVFNLLRDVFDNHWSKL